MVHYQVSNLSDLRRAQSAKNVYDGRIALAEDVRIGEHEWRSLIVDLTTGLQNGQGGLRSLPMVGLNTPTYGNRSEIK